MRFLGPGSISSILKIALDAVYYAVFALLAALCVAILTLLSVPALAEQVTARVQVDMDASDQVLLLLIFGLALNGYLVIVLWMRQVFRTLAEGDVFHPANVWRLRLIGIALGVLEIYSYLSRTLVEALLNMPVEPVYGMRAVTAWVSVLVVFVLAEVFKEGARLRAEANLTI
ncbi:DUF2975 domain-containing protein [Asticcacaulis tiandongensis]|uniref:DUF2975 domain-containing protein n=1 Tax=Asticcacaulis tiandongensis TaxID=2565365 RepID=UPI00112D14F6|nr:DUF2975 domain-containing protein [Asticcacaulis tiandongensis]